VSGAAPLPCAGSAHLTLLLSEVDALAGHLREVVAGLGGPGAPAVGVLRAAADAAAVAATLRLDGADPGLGRMSGLGRGGERGGAGGGEQGGERAGTWADALAPVLGDDTVSDVDAADLAAMAARERDGAAAGFAADDLAEAFGAASSDPNGLGAALGALHGRLVEGLVAPERVGMLRQGPRVVQDASVGRVLFFPTEPALLPDAWDALLRHLAGPGAASRGPALVRAGLLHLELLRRYPFDAAGGRLARAAARLALRADGIDVAGLVAVEPVLSEDPLGYLDGVAASMRRRDATAWIERWAEAVGEALRRALDATGDAPMGAADGAPGTPPPTALPDGLGTAFTLAEAAEALASSVDRTRATLSVLVRTGRVRRVAGSSGLRFARRDATAVPA
jgi:hypothetical protein